MPHCGIRLSVFGETRRRELLLGFEMRYLPTGRFYITIVCGHAACGRNALLMVICYSKSGQKSYDMQEDSIRK